MTPDAQRLNSLLAAIPHGIQENDVNGVITYSNAAHHEMLGYETGELVGRTIFELLDDEGEKDELKQYLAYLVAEQPSPTPYITKTRCKDGASITTQIDWAYQYNKHGGLTGFVSIISDITERQILQDTLQKERDLARHYLDVAQFMMVILDANGNISLVNKKTCAVLGYSADQLLKRNWIELCIPANRRDEISRVFKQLIQGQTELAEYYENTVLTATGEERLIAWHNTFQHDADGNICGTISSGEDITDKKLAKEEKRKLYEQIRKIQKMEALGRLTSGIAHDFNNILASILGYADLTLDTVSRMGEQELMRYVNEIIKEGEKARDLITQMLTFARADSGEDIAIDPVPQVKELAKMLQASLPQSIELRINAEPDIPKALIDPSQLHQAVLNVCLNALDAMNNKAGEITINLSRITCYQDRCNACHELFDGEYVEISVADTGYGMETFMVNKLFEPFLSLKKTGDHNNNLSLATTSEIIHEHGGHILVESIINYGTTVRLLLPSAYAHQKSVRLKGATRKLADSSANVLIVEDEESIANLQSELLQSRGFKTTVCSDAYKALAKFTTTPQKFDCIVVDQEMPSLSGTEFSKKAQEIRAEIPIILCSTKNQIIDRQTLAQLGIQGQLTKPFTSEELVNQINCLLHAADKKG